MTDRLIYSSMTNNDVNAAADAAYEAGVTTQPYPIGTNPSGFHGIVEVFEHYPCGGDDDEHIGCIEGASVLGAVSSINAEALLSRCVRCYFNAYGPLCDHHREELINGQ